MEGAHVAEPSPPLDCLLDPCGQAHSCIAAATLVIAQRTDDDASAFVQRLPLPSTTTNLSARIDAIHMVR